MKSNKPISYLKETDVTLAGGGNETFDALTRKCFNGTYAAEIKDAASGGIGGTVTINLEVALDDQWETMTDDTDADITGDLTQSGSLQFHVVDIPVGARVRPKFVTDQTGDLVYKSYV